MCVRVCVCVCVCFFAHFSSCGSFFQIHESPIESNNAINLYDKSKSNNPFALADAFPDPEPEPDPLCNINLRETSEFVKSLPTSNGSTDSRGFSAHRRREGSNCLTQRRVEAPSTPGRPVFSFTSARKSFPSKWDDAEKWVMSTTSSSHHFQSPAHHSHTVSVNLSEPSNMSNHCLDFKQQMQDFADKSRVTQERVSKPVPNFQGSLASLDHHNNGISCSTDIVLKGGCYHRLYFKTPPFPCLYHFQVSTYLSPRHYLSVSFLLCLYLSSHLLLSWNWNIYNKRIPV